MVRSCFLLYFAHSYLLIDAPRWPTFFGDYWCVCAVWDFKNLPLFLFLSVYSLFFISLFSFSVFLWVTWTPFGTPFPSIDSVFELCIAFFFFLVIPPSIIYWYYTYICIFTKCIYHIANNSLLLLSLTTMIVETFALNVFLTFPIYSHLKYFLYILWEPHQIVL